MLISLVVFSCKEEKKNDLIEEKIGNDFFVVKLNVVAQKDDSFHVFYTEDGSINFNEENSVWFEFKGSPEKQDLVFNLPEGVSPNQLRLDFGINKEQGDVKINNIEVSYKGKVLNIPGAMFTKYFTANEANTKVDTLGQTLKPIEEGINTSLYPLESLQPELEKLLQ
jgi:hypothetical protein